MHVEFDALCREPVKVCKKLYDFMLLDYDDDTVAKIEKMTTGNNQGYYSTDKNSIQILRQGYKYLTKKHLIQINSMLKNGR